MSIRLIASLCVAGLLLLAGCDSTETTAVDDADAGSVLEPSTVDSGETPVEDGVMRIEEHRMGPIGTGQVVEANENSEVVLDGWDAHATDIDQSKNYFVIFRPRGGDEGFLTTGRFIERPGEETAKIKMNQGGDKISAEHVMLIFRPENASNEFVNNFKAVVPLSDPKPGSGQTMDQTQATALKSQSMRRIRDIVLAMHNYHGQHGCFPPGVLYGPDGKPWHSWRTLILPYLDQSTVYELYDFTQPWDSAANESVMEIDIAGYSDPVHGNNPEHYAHFAVGIGDNTLMPGINFDGTKAGFDAALKEGVTMNDITDGTTMTMMVGTVSPKDKIRWTEPRDVFIYQGVPEVDAENGFAAVHLLNGEPGVLVGMADGSTQGLTKSYLSKENLTTLLTINGGDELPPQTASPAMERTPQVIIKLKADGENSTAEFTLE